MNCIGRCSGWLAPDRRRQQRKMHANQPRATVQGHALTNITHVTSQHLLRSQGLAQCLLFIFYHSFLFMRFRRRSSFANRQFLARTVQLAYFARVVDDVRGSRAKRADGPRALFCVAVSSAPLRATHIIHMQGSPRARQPAPPPSSSLFGNFIDHDGNELCICVQAIFPHLSHASRSILPRGQAR